MARFDHPNVMKLLGVSISKSRTLLVIMPYMAQGSLLSYLRKNKDQFMREDQGPTEMVNTRTHSLKV